MAYVSKYPNGAAVDAQLDLATTANQTALNATNAAQSANQAAADAAQAAGTAATTANGAATAAQNATSAIQAETERATTAENANTEAIAEAAAKVEALGTIDYEALQTAGFTSTGTDLTAYLIELLDKVNA